MAPSRRSFLAASWSLAAASVWAHRAEGIVLRRLKVPDNLFTLGVASGDPSPSGFVIWTRLAPRPLEGGGMPDEAVEVAWEVAEDDRFVKVVARGTVSAISAWAHSVHIEVDGLKPDRTYWYRFHAAGTGGPVGRTRTLPAADSLPDRLRFTFASCQHFESGLFTAYEHMAQDDLDLVVHLGDYIYEAARGPQAAHACRLPQSPRPVQDRRRPASRSRGLSLAGDLGRPRV
jgi:alkaline phosphatase D